MTATPLRVAVSRSAVLLRSAVVVLSLVVSAFADVFVDVAVERGIDYETVSGAKGQRFLVETMLPGVAWLDFDGDGFLDLYIVQGHEHPARAAEGVPAAGPANRLYRNVGGRFEIVSDAAGAGHRGYGMGASAADFDNDGDPDLLVTNYGADVLYENRGGRFVDVTDKAGVALPTVQVRGESMPRWSASATWADVDGDGLLDLYVVGYLGYDTRRHAACPTELPGARQVGAYCNPRYFEGIPDVLFRGLGGGRFEDVSERASIAAHRGAGAGKGLGVIASDIDGDGDSDVLIANDSVANGMWRNLGGLRFEDAGLETGFALNANGEMEAGMGIAKGDFDGDGWLDVLVTNFSRETNTLYAFDGDFFRDATVETRLARASFLPLGFGTRAFDYDLDGDLDLYVANGHVLDNVALLHPGEQVSYAQHDQLFENDGQGRFQDVSRKAGSWFAERRVGRAVAECDFDNDGDGDLVVTHSSGKVALLENRATGATWIGVELVRRGVIHGARVTIDIEGDVPLDRVREAEAQRDGSYLASHDPRLRFGLPHGTERVTVRVAWPGSRGAPEVFESLVSGRYHKLVATR